MQNKIDSSVVENHPKFVDYLAHEYLHRHKTAGHAAAIAWYETLLDESPDLQEHVRLRIIELVKVTPPPSSA